MPTHLAQWQQFHGPLIAFAVALGLALAGRFLRVGLLAAAAGGAGVVAGGTWSPAGSGWLSPTASVDALTGLAAIALLIGMLCAWLGPGRLAWIGMLLAALAAGWLLSGAPRHPAALRASWPIGLGVALAVLLFARALAGQALDRLRLALAGLTLAAALHVRARRRSGRNWPSCPASRHWRCSPCRRCQGRRRCRSPSISPLSAALR